MKKGAFQTSREIFNNDIWLDVTKFRLFFYIVGNAVFAKDGIKHAGMKLNRGQYLRSYRNLREDLEYLDNNAIKKYSNSMISRKIDELVDEDRLQKEVTKHGTLFTVVNYDQYQGFEGYKKSNLEGLRNGTGMAEEGLRNNNKNVKNVKNVKKKDKDLSPKRKSVYDAEHLELAKLFYSEILKNNPNYKKPNFDKWADDIRKMISIDKRTVKQIRYLMIWVQQDDFWCGNVLSPTKLRKQFDQLVIKVTKDNELKKGKKNIVSIEYDPEVDSF